MTDAHEQLSGGVAAADAGSDTTTTVRIAPLPEGERTLGQSGKETVWDREPLEAAVDAGALDGATLVKGEGGVNPHFPMDEQVPPENILARVDTWTYEDGVGPVGKADVVDEQMAKRIDAGLLEVSADLERHLGEYDEERDAYQVDELVSMPRVTVLERGASPNASIATVEALGYNPSGDNQIEQLASTHSPSFTDTSSGEWPGRPALQDFDSDDLSEVGQHFLASLSGFSDPDTYGDLKLPVVAPDGTLYLDALESAHRFASRTKGLTDEAVSYARTTAERLADEEFDTSLTEEQNATEQLADLRTVRFSAFGEMFGAEFLDTAVGNLEALDGVMAMRSSEQTDPSLVAIIDPDAADLNTLNEDIVDALDETPFEVFGDFDWIEASGSDREYLAGAQASDEGADTSTGTDADDDTQPMDDDPSKEQLREQLAAAKAEKNQLETERDSLEEKTETLESDLEEKESELEAKEETIESKEETIDSLESENEPLRKALATRAATGSSLSADVIADSDVSNEDLAESIVENEGLADEDDDVDPIEKVSEQLAQAPAQRGQSPDDTESGGSTTPPDQEQLAAANSRAKSVMTGSDIMQAASEEMSAHEYLAEFKGVDATEYSSETALRQAVEQASGGDD